MIPALVSNKMTVKEAIIKTLEDLDKLSNYTEVYQHIVTNKYYEFAGTTPASTVSAQLGDFIKKEDARVNRVATGGGNYSYYLASNENIKLDASNLINNKINSSVKNNNYNERDLHKILSSYLKNSNIFSKNILHEKSLNSKDSNQKWIHPDMVGIKFLNLQTDASQALLKTINKVDSFKINSYEIKKQINSDYELKQYYFQAVSNSSWANFGYLVAFDINTSLNDEMERLNQSFGIGIIKLKPNPYESKILFPAKYKILDFNTIDKLCKVNSEFRIFIEQVDKLLTASDKYIKSTEKEMDEFCDDYFLSDTEIEKYCKEKNISTQETDS